MRAYYWAITGMLEVPGDPPRPYYVLGRQVATFACTNPIRNIGRMVWGKHQVIVNSSKHSCVLGCVTKSNWVYVCNPCNTQGAWLRLNRLPSSSPLLGCERRQHLQWYQQEIPMGLNYYGCFNITTKKEKVLGGDVFDIKNNERESPRWQYL